MSGNVVLIHHTNPLDVRQREIRQVAWVCGLTLADCLRIMGCDHGEEYVVVRAGKVEKDLTARVGDGDWVHMSRKTGAEIVTIFTAIAGLVKLATAAITGPFAAAGGSMGAGLTGNMYGGMLGAQAGAWVGSHVLTMALGIGVSMGAGAIINGIMGGPSGDSPSPQSPTYGWGANNNPSGEGAALPVVYGHVMTVPAVINQYVEVGGAAAPGWAASASMYVHTLLAVHEGKTNNLPTAAGVWANDEPLGLFFGFEVKATDGSGDPDVTKLDKFHKLHQYRHLNKPLGENLAEDFLKTLLHLNGTHGSTTITEDGPGTNVYACQGGAHLSTANPFLGTAALDVTGAGDYITCDTPASFDLFGSLTLDWDLEFKFRQSALQDGVICGQQRIDAASEFYWAVCYNSGSLQFQYYKREDPGDGWVDVTFFDVSGAAGLLVDTWHHVRICKFQPTGETNYTVRVFVDGQLIASGIQFAALEAAPSGVWSQQVGRGFRLEAGAAVQYDALCEIDEFRIVIGQLARDVNGFTPPAAELSYDIPEYFTTKGMVDALTFTLEAPRGIYFINSNAELEVWYTQIYYSYRKVGDSAWTGGYHGFSGASREPLWKQWTVTLPERAKYEIRGPFRATPPDVDTQHQSTTYWIGLDEILNEFLTYPWVHCVQVSLQAQDRMSGSIPTYRVVSNRTEIEVPTFDGTSTQLVDPRKPAWAAYDMFTNPLSGPGTSPVRFDSDTWQDLIDWGAGLVAGNARCQANIVFDQFRSFDQSLQEIESVGRFRAVTRGTKISCVIEKPTPARQLFSARNIIKRSYSSYTLKNIQQADRIEIQFKDRDSNWTTQTQFANSSEYTSLTRTPRVVNVFMAAINNAEQALREAILRMNLTEKTKFGVDWGADLEAICSTAGDVTKFQHLSNAMEFGGGIGADTALGSRITLGEKWTIPSATHQGSCIVCIRKANDMVVTIPVLGPWDVATDTVLLGDEYAVAHADLEAGPYEMTFRRVSGVIENVDVDSALETEDPAAFAAIDWAARAAEAATFTRFDPYLIGRTNEDIREYRIVTATRGPRQRYAMKGALYDETAYYHANYEGGSVAI